MEEKNDTIAIAKRYFELSNNRELNSIPKLFCNEIIYSSDNTGVYFGKDNVMQMMDTFFSKFKFLNWKINSIELIKDLTVEIYFILKTVDNEGNEFEKKGIERLIIYDHLIKYIEVRNISN
jgi:hypothetical protein